MNDPMAVIAESKAFSFLKALTMQGLWRLALWGATAASALLIAVLATRGEVGARRSAVVLSSFKGDYVLPRTAPQAPQALQSEPPAAPRSVDERVDLRRILDAMRGLAADNDQLKSRLATLEHNIDDVTGSITRGGDAGETATRSTAAVKWPDAAQSLPPNPAGIAAIGWPMMAPAMLYGVDVGSALSITTLRARWAGIRSAHPQLFAGLMPAVALRQMPNSSHVELRLIIGPFATIEAAAELCNTLGSYRLFCQPTNFGGQQLALE